MIGALAALGIPAGAFIAHSVPDETGWYPRWFLGASTLAAITAAFFEVATGGAVYGLIGAGALIYSQTRDLYWLGALGAALIVLAGSLAAAELVFASLLFAAGYAWSRGARWELAWYGLMPIVIIVVRLLA